MEYLTEERGGYDEWSDRYESVVGVRLDDGTEVRSPKVTFSDSDGNRVVVDLPETKRIGDTIYVEQFDPTHKQQELNSLDELQEYVETEGLTIEK